MTEPEFLPYGRPVIDEQDVDGIVRVLGTQWLSSGPTVAAFESALAARLHAECVVACSSGTAALHLCALAIDLKPLDAVLVPAITFLATANAARYVGAEVVFLDVDPNTGLVTPRAIDDGIARAKKMGLNPRVIIPVHYAGQVAKVHGYARSRGLLVIEDACHALGTTYESESGAGRVVGDCTESECCVFSFHPLKSITTGEGGAITCNDKALGERLRRLRNHGMNRDAKSLVNASVGSGGKGRVHPWYYEMDEMGFNYRLTDIQSALGISQLRKLDVFLEQRRQLVAAYDERLGGCASFKLLGRVGECKPAWHLYVGLLDCERLGISREGIMNELAERGIGTQVHYLPVYRQPYYERRYGQILLQGAEAFYESALTLPLFPSMSTSDVERVVAGLRTVGI